MLVKVLRKLFWLGLINIFVSFVVSLLALLLLLALEFVLDDRFETGMSGGAFYASAMIAFNSSS